jgi:F-type H+-transporting ATPase subunit epsilon
MHLKVLLPSQLFADHDDVSRITAGSFGLLPHRLDCVAALTPGILAFETATGGEQFIAIDQGVLIKTGPDVLVSVRRALGGTDLAHLRDAVARQFLTLNAEDTHLRSVMSKLEATVLRHFATMAA